MEYYDSKEPAVRENRLGSCNSYGGNVKDLLECAQGGCMNLACRRFHQTQLCQSSLSLSWVDTVSDPVVIMHSPVGCGGMNMFMRELFFDEPDKLRYVRTINTNLSETDVISGGEDKLREAILYAEEKFHPENIFVMMTCVPTLTGDDADAVIDSVKSEVKANIMPVYCAGFKSKIPASAYDALYHGIIKTYLREKEEEVEANLRKNNGKKVNLFNTSSTSHADQDELKRLLELLGLEVRILPYDSPTKYLTEMVDASLNVSICTTHDEYLFQYMEEVYGIPYVMKNIPVGIGNTSLWLREVAKFFGKEKEAEKVIEQEVGKLERALAPYRKILSGKTAFIHGGEPRSLATADTLERLGVEVLGIETRHHDRFSNELLEKRKNNEKMTYSVAIGQPFEKANLLERMKPDIYVGHNGQCVQPAKQGIPVYPLFYKPNNYFGFTGVFEIARGLARMTRNIQFYKNLRENLRLPYQESWYEKEPFSYIKSGETI
ncbi:nitrogenase component 1 [Claveliimonas bilis]|uniref:Oxidoreductase nitrogenase component 1 n=1 Tax=Claveliimonas bilis TaxID=3028070 RepID=A0ABM8IE16_9FIRM|nr:nitrogenase component 1 [Claveliimonas bilis]BDZ78635.1 oxidoreductase nitrogenase component 1 [Claveliimonas bilis]